MGWPGGDLSPDLFKLLTVSKLTLFGPVLNRFATLLLISFNFPVMLLETVDVDYRYYYCKAAYYDFYTASFDCIITSFAPFIAGGGSLLTGLKGG